MNTSSQPRVVVVTRPTYFQELIGHHGTRAQARFFLETRGQSIDRIELQHREFEAALNCVLTGIPVHWRRSRISRCDLDRFLFEPDDIVVVLGQDGLVANVARYLNGQPVLGFNPAKGRYEGVLVPHQPEAIADSLKTITAGRGSFEHRTMVQALLDDGQALVALNEIFIGHSSHQSARYRIHWDQDVELQSSSGVIVSTGTGSTGWATSIRRSRHCSISPPRPTESRLVFMVREAWPGVRLGTSVIDGSLGTDDRLELVSHMNTGGVIFGDGMEDDHIEFNWGRRVSLQLAAAHLNLLKP